MSWLTELKAGDEVVAGHGIAKVEKITPAGRIKVAGAYYNPNTAHAIGTWYLAPWIEEATPKKREMFRQLEIKTKAYRLMEKFKPRDDKIDVDTAKKIIEILEPLTKTDERKEG